ncbi:hypothetical protein ES707_01103 [subsurface metagenome]
MLESVLKRVLQAVFGGGTDISAANPLEVHDPKVGSLISYEGTTTADGAGDGSTLICSDLTTKPDYDGNLVIITSGDYEGQARDINGITTGGTVTPASAFGGKIVSGVTFVIVGIRTVPAEVAAIITSQGRILIPMTKFSEGKIQVQINAAGATITLPTITIANLPAGATVVEAHLMFKFRMIENKYAGVNKLNGATVALTSQVIQIQDDGGGAWADAINFVDDFFTLADGIREGGDLIVGTLNVGVTGVVDGNDTYNVRFLLGKADQDFINFDDCQVGLQIWYSI